MVESPVIDALVKVGRAGVPAVPESLRDRDQAWRLLVRGFPEWRAAADTLEEPALRAAVRGLLLFAQASGWSGGSVSPVVPLYRRYEERFPGTASSLAEWVLANRQNEYEPFGYILPLSVRSLDALAEWRRLDAEKRAARRAQEVVEQEEAAARRAERATRLLLSAVRRGDASAVAALLQRGADPSRAAPRGETLLSVALDSGRTAVVELLRSRNIG